MNDQEFIETLHKFRDEPVPFPLTFRPSIERLMDTEHCTKVCAVFHKHSKWERTAAFGELGASLPEERGVYMFVWKPQFVLPFCGGKPEQPWWVLYVGKAGSEHASHDTIKTRYVREYSKFVGGDVGVLWDKKQPGDRAGRLARYLALRPLEYWFLLLADPAEIEVLERKLIRMFSPPVNHHLAGARLKLGTPVPAFHNPSDG